MEVLKQAVSVPIFGTVIWLAWVLASAYGAAVLAALLVCLLLLAIAGWFLGRWPAKGWATTLAMLIVAGVLALCALAPGRLVAAAQTSARGSAGLGTVQGTWQPWSAEAVAQAQAQGRPVFVDFTASWCLSCQVNERVALGQPEVQKAFADANVVLLKADWTQHDDAITQTLAGLGRSGVPTYVLYAPGSGQPQILPEVLTASIVTDALHSLRH